MKKYLLSALLGLTITGVHAQDAKDVIPPPTIPNVNVGTSSPVTPPALEKPRKNAPPNAAKAAQRAKRAKAAQAKAAAKTPAATPVAAAPVAPVATPAPPAIPSLEVATPPIPSISPVEGPVLGPVAGTAEEPSVPAIPNVAVTERIVKSTTGGSTARNTSLPLLNTTTGSGKPFRLRSDMAIANTVEIPIAKTSPVGGPPPPEPIKKAVTLPSAVGSEVTEIEVTKISNEQIANQLLQTTRGLPVQVETEERSAIVRIGVIRSEPIPAPAPYVLKPLEVVGSASASSATIADDIPIAQTIPVESEAPEIEAPAPVVVPEVEVAEIAAEVPVEAVAPPPEVVEVAAPVEVEAAVTPTGSAEDGWRAIAVPNQTAAAEGDLPILNAPSVEAAEVAATAVTATPTASGIPAGLAPKRTWNPFRAKKKVLVPATSVEVPETAVRKKPGIFRKR